jgi:hypothetical protein
VAEFPGGWELAGFPHRLDAWIEQDSPSGEVVEAVVGWIMSRYDNPYRGVQREPGFDSLWFGKIPGTVVAGTAVCCSYFIEERRRMVVCDSLATLTLPV